MKDILLFTVKALASTITDSWIIFGFVVVGIIFYGQNKKISEMQEMIIGQKLSNPFELTISQIVMGLLAGIAGSIILSFVGVTFNEQSSFSLVFLISLMLVLINPKYICFSYSGAIVGLISIMAVGLSSVYHFNTEYFVIDIVSLMTLVGIMHIIEGFLIMIDGRRGAIPVFTNKNDKISGGFAFKRYWALPLMIMLLSLSKSTGSSGVDISIPSWWPLVGTTLSHNLLKNATMLIVPILGAIGYSSITFSQSKIKKTLTSGVLNVVYGTAVAFIAQIADKGIVFQLIVVIIVPLLHQFMLLGSNLIEKRLPLKFVSDDEGIVVLDIAPHSPAYDMGITSGDKLLEFNGEKIVDEKVLSNISDTLLKSISFLVKRNSGQIQKLTYDKVSKNQKLGIVFVPREIPDESVVVKLNERSFKEFVNKYKNNDDNKKDDNNKNE